MLHLSTLLKHYKRRDIQEAMVLASQDREVAVKFGDNGFGKRPEVLLYPNDVLEFAKQGATSFHISEERWSNVMQISTGMRKQELEALRKGWDLVIDIDCKLWNYSKLIAHLIVQELKAHGIRSVTVKFSGNKGFHIAVPFEAFPPEVHGQPLPLLFPEGVRRIALYLVEKIKPKLLQHIKQHDSFANIALQLGISEHKLSKTICGNCKKSLKEQQHKTEFVCLSCETREEGTEAEKFMVCKKCSKIMEKVETSQQIRCPFCKSTTIVDELDLGPLLQVDTVLISSRHLYRMPYSLHEKSGLCSVPIDSENILSFERDMAKPETVSIQHTFLSSQDVVSGEATQLVVQAFDFLPAQGKEENEKKSSDFDEEVLQSAIPQEFFPPCMKLGFAGVGDGKKRFLFAAVNFLLSCGYDYATIDTLLEEWNKKNPEPLREVLVKGQLRYAQQTRKKIMPPNCNNLAYYVDIGICKPDGICAKIKNPVQYAKRRAFLANLDKTRADNKGSSEKTGPRERLNEGQREMRREYRAKLKEQQKSSPI